MDLHQLKVFQAVVKAGSFTRASNEIYLSQSTVSQHIKQLELQLGCQLFTRVGKRVLVTDAGRILFEHCERIFANVRNAEVAIRELNELQHGRLRLGTGITTLTYQLPPVLKAFKADYPGIELIVVMGITEAVVHQLRTQNIDMGLVTLPVAASDLRVTTLFAEELLITMNVHDPLARRKALVIDDLNKLSFILYEKHTMLRSAVDHFFAELGITPRVIMEMGNVEAIKSLVEAGLGVSILPHDAVRQESEAGKLRLMRVEKNQVFRQIGLVTLKTDFVPRAVSAMSKLITDHFKKKRKD